MKAGFRVLDSDLHVIEPSDLYDRYLDPKFRDRTPRPTATRGAYTSQWTVGDFTFPRPLGRGRVDAEKRAAAVLKDYAAARFDSASQQRAMDVEGLDVAVLFRTLPVVCVDAFEPAFASALCRAWNDWAADFRRPAPGRMHAAALVTLHDATLAAEELSRSVKELGFVAAQMMPNPVNGVNLHDPRMDPLWAEAERLNVPICFHPAPNNYSDTHFVNRYLTAPSTTIAGGLNNPVELMAAVASMTAGGVLAASRAYAWRSSRATAAGCRGSCGGSTSTGQWRRAARRRSCRRRPASISGASASSAWTRTRTRSSG